MENKKKLTKKVLVKTFFGYGYHIWVILILANVLLVYSVQFYLRAAQKTEPVEIAQQSVPPTDAPEPTAIPNTPTTTPIPTGPVLNVAFSVPGIGTNGANLKPQHPKRNLYILIYSPEENSSNSTVKPVYSLTGFVTYDANPKSPTYTQFVNTHLDLGDKIKNERYQLVFKMDQMLAKLIKDKDNSVGGKLFGLNKNQIIDVAPQTFIVGDIYNPPNGDNIMDMKDHDMLLSCFGTKADTKTCSNKQNADLNDDGAVDGTDYNIMLGSFRTLKSLGFPVPSLGVPSPSTPFSSQISKKPTVSKKPAKPSPSAIPASSGGGGGAAVAIIIILLLLGGGVGGFFAYKKGLFKKFMNPSPKGTPAPTEEGAAETPPAEGEATPAVEGTETQPATEEIAESPVTPDATTPETTDITAPPTDTPVVDAIDKEYYIKKAKDDEATKGVWLTLTDDSGPIEGYYKTGGEITEGFARIKGTKKIEGEKTYIDVSEIIPEG